MAAYNQSLRADHKFHDGTSVWIDRSGVEVSNQEPEDIPVLIMDED